MPVERRRKYTKKQAYFIILKRMFLESRLKKGDFESPRRNAQGISGDFIIDSSQDRNISENRGLFKHSSIKKWFDELEERHCIEKTRTSMPSGRIAGLYDITFPGLIELLSLSHERGFDPGIWSRFLYHMPIYLPPVFDKLLRLFPKEDLFNVLTRVCKNTTLLISEDPRREQNFPVILPSSYYSPEYKWLNYYRVQVKVSHADTTHQLFYTVLLAGRNHSQKEIRIRQRKAITEIRGMILTAFLHELTNGLPPMNLDEEPLQHVRRDNSVLDIIKNNIIVRENYMKFLEQIEDIERLQKSHIQKIKRYIAS